MTSSSSLRSAHDNWCNQNFIGKQTMVLENHSPMDDQFSDDLSDCSLLKRTETDYREGQIISKLYGMGRRPTTIALSFRSPRQPDHHRRLPRLKVTCTKVGANLKKSVSSMQVASGIFGAKEITTDNLRTNLGLTVNKSQRNVAKANGLDKSEQQMTPKPIAVPSKNELPRTSVVDMSKTVKRIESIAIRATTDVVTDPNRPSSSNKRTSVGISDSEKARLDLTEVTVLPPSARQKRTSIVASDSDKVIVNLQGLQPSTVQKRTTIGAVDFDKSLVELKGLYPKPRLDSLFNTHVDIQNFRRLIRESTDEDASLNRINYCNEATTIRVESWLKSVRKVRETEGLCRQTVDATLESERRLRDHSGGRYDSDKSDGEK